VTNQCSVTGANVNLGNYTTAQTWGDVGAALGGYDGATFTAGSLGKEYLNWGSVTCDNTVPYTLKIDGTGVNGAIKIAIGAKSALFNAYIKKVGAAVVADTDAHAAGTPVNGTSQVSATGTGVQQDLLGSVLLGYTFGGTAVAADTLATAGTYSDNLSYTLTF
jgi:spore coat protein U-like protein